MERKYGNDIWKRHMEPKCGIDRLCKDTRKGYQAQAILFYEYWFVAQLAEQSAVNRQVEGSSPSVPAS